MELLEKQAKTSSNNAEKVWFITGASRGFGRVWTEAALNRGDKVVATARKLDRLAALNVQYGEQVLTLELDVTKADQVQSAVATAHAHFGRLDIICNNAVYALVGTIEEASIAEVRALYETNVMGPLLVIQAALPFLRQQGNEHILGTSSGLGHLARPLIGYYCSSKWAFEAIHESLAIELQPFGIDVTIIEPGAYATEFGGQDSLQFAAGMPIYEDLRQQVMTGLKNLEQGNPKATPAAVFKVVDAAKPPLRLFLGSHNLPEVREAYQQRLSIWQEWEAVANAAQG